MNIRPHMNRCLRIAPLFLAAILVIAACSRRDGAAERKGGNDKLVFTDDVRLRTTPVKDQGKSELCWIYAMLSTIETDRLELGDSVNLSPAYLERMMIEEQSREFYFSKGRKPFNSRGLAGMTLNLIDRHGLLPYDSYEPRNSVNHNVLERKMAQLCMRHVVRRDGLKKLSADASDLLDDEIWPLPNHVYMYGMEYSPHQFAMSVCHHGDYVGLTSFTHHPFGEEFPLEVPDNRDRLSLINVPIDSLMTVVTNTILAGHAVCWEGDVSERGFSFKNGTATLSPQDDGYGLSGEALQRARQRAFEKFSTTDDHCMSLIGIAHDRAGRRYFIAKNSWGSRNPYHGYMYMSDDYMRMKTIAVFFKAKKE